MGFLMRRTLFATSVFFAALLLPQASFASGNVLLPSTSGQSPSPPNLGLGSPTETTSAPTPTKDQTPQPAAPPASVSGKPPATALSTATKQPIPAAGPTKPKPTLPPTFVIVGDQSHLRPGEIPTIVMKRPDLSAYTERAGKNLPYTLTIQFSDKSFFGAKDVQEITKKLGLKSSEISSACFLAPRGLLRTDKKGYIIDSGSVPQSTVHYDGMIQSYMMLAEAECTAEKLPLNSGVLSQIGNRYAISLQPVTCTPPNRQVTTLTITYDGSPTSKCLYN